MELCHIGTDLCFPLTDTNSKIVLGRSTCRHLSEAVSRSHAAATLTPCDGSAGMRILVEAFKPTTVLQHQSGERTLLQPSQTYLVSDVPLLAGVHQIDIDH